MTVIIPCYNVEEYIAECLDSVKLQGDVVGRVYCVDNGSTDGTLAAIEGWRERNPDRPVEVLHEAVRGACAARNKPLDLVDTEWVQFLDADDLLLEGKIRSQIAGCPDADVIYDSSVYRNVSGAQKESIPDIDTEIGLIAGNLGNTCTNLWRTSYLREVQGWDTSLSSSQEYDLMLRIYEKGGKFARMVTGRTMIRERASGQISQGAAKGRWTNLVNVQVRMLAAFGRVEMGTEKSRAIQQALFGGLRMLYPHDPAYAVQLFRKHLAPLGFVPDVGAMNTKMYVRAFRIFGFRGAERIKALQNAIVGE